MTRRPLLRVRDLVARYGAHTVLDGVRFDVFPGEICAILGGSGCGKSTLLKHLMGLYRPAAGRIEIDGVDLTGLEGEALQRVRRGMGVLFQTGALFGAMTVGENVALPLREYTDLSEEVIQMTVRLKLDMVGLAHVIDREPAELSGGMRKRVALARAMALDPKLLLFDEMSAGLDPITSAELDRLVRAINRTLGITIVMVTHELPSIEAIADRVVMLDRGRVVAEGRPAALAQSDHPMVRAFFHREPLDVELDSCSDWADVLVDRPGVVS